jgi:ectoine hydroxylase-related dioxygenase (phytanoyl-CoA dioxygenase family)
METRMKSEQILARPPLVLSQEQREFYFENGYLLLPEFVSPEWLERLREVSNAFIERSRGLTESDTTLALEPTHSAEKPRLRRLIDPTEHHPIYWEHVSQGPLADVAEDLLGPAFKFHHSKLNFKWSSGGEEIKWHQDIQFYPHTNYSVAAFGLYLDDVDHEMGPMGVIPGSHRGEIHDQYDEQDNWVGHIGEHALGRVDLDKVEWLTGPAGSVTVHNCRTVHGSLPNMSDRSRPLLLHTCTAADALPLTPRPSQTSHEGRMIRGQPARWVTFDADACQLPPDRSNQPGVTIFSSQNRERSI